MHNEIRMRLPLVGNFKMAIMPQFVIWESEMEEVDPYGPEDLGVMVD